MTTTPTSGAAIQRYKIGYHADEWGQRSSTPSGIPDASGSWVRYADHVTALAAGQATAAQAVVQDDLITIRKPTTSAEMLWLLKLAHLVISDVDKTLEETFAPAQPVAEQGAAYAALPTSSHAGRVYEEGFLIGTCPLYTADKMRAFADATCALRASHGQAPAETGNSVSAQTDSVQEDAAREAIEEVLALFPFNVPIQKFTVNNGPCLTADNDDEFYSVKRVLAFLTEIKTTLDAARKQGATQ